MSAREGAAAAAAAGAEEEEKGRKAERDETMTRVGSREYYQGFLTRDVREDAGGERGGAGGSARRGGDGTEQAIKLALQASLLLTLGVLAFLKSNAII